MCHYDMTKWIENAEARHVFESAMVGRDWTVTESHYVHLGKAIAKVPVWSRQAVSRESLLSFGSQALALVRHPLTRKPV
jgi:hypothetical protein